MIYVTHDQIEAMTLADRIAIMRGGQILQLASPNEIYNRPANKYVAEFIGSPTMNFFEGELEEAGGNYRFTSGGKTFSLDGYTFQNGPPAAGAAWFGIRPEHMVSGAEADTALVRLDGQVELVEPLGSDTLVRFTTGDQTLWVRMDGQANIRHGDAITVGFDPARANLFDKTSESRL
jgi:multiple sugar transport system ATP-binding protein